MKKFKSEKKSTLQKIPYLFSLENRAQSGAVFRLMIDGIIGLAILLIIISALSYFQVLRGQADNEKFYSLVKSATESPNGKVFSEKNLLLPPGGFSSISIRNKTNIYEGCFDFQSNLVSAKITGDDVEVITFTTGVETNVYAQCDLGEDCTDEAQECCKVTCVISFGKRIIEEEA